MHKARPARHFRILGRLVWRAAHRARPLRL